MKKDCLRLQGIVKEALPGCKFIVEVYDPMKINIICSLAGKMRKNNIRIIENDTVEVEVSVYDFTNGRIVWRRK